MLSLLLQHGGVGLLDAEHEVAEGAVDVLAAALHGGAVGRVAHVDGDGARVHVVAGVQRVQLLVAGDDQVRVGARRQHDAAARRVRRHRDLRRQPADSMALLLKFCLYYLQ